MEDRIHRLSSRARVEFIPGQRIQGAIFSSLHRSENRTMDVRVDQEKPAIFYFKSIQNEMIRLKRRMDVADFRFAMLLWDIHKQVRCNWFSCFSGIRKGGFHARKGSIVGLPYAIKTQRKARNAPSREQHLSLGLGVEQSDLTDWA